MGAKNVVGLVRALWGARRSAAFEAFRRRLDDGAGRRLDLAALATLQGRERRRAEQMLLDALPDPCAIEALGELATARARRRLSALFEQQCARAQAASVAGETHWNGAALIASAAALWRLAPQDRFVRVIIGRLRHARAASERMDAAAALARMPNREADQALNEALDDRDALVRHHVARALLVLHGVEIDAHAAHCLIYAVMAGEAARREEGLRDIARALAQRPLRAGRDQRAPGALI